MTKEKNKTTTDCPVCKTKVEPQNNKLFPFCSERCQAQDLGHWLKGDYTIPGPPTWNEDDDKD